MKKRGVEDVLDVFSLQAVPGFTGILVCALFSEEKFHRPPILSRSQLFGVALLGCVITTVISVVATYVIIRLTDRLIGVNISIETELHGLDKMEIGEVAYGLDDDEDDDKLCIKLCEFSAAGDLLEIKRFYRFHHSLDFKDDDDRSALHIAAAEGHLEVCKFLVKKGLDVNSEDKYGRKPIVDALFKGHRDVVIFLKQEGTKIDLSKYADKWFMAIISKEKRSIQCYISIGI